MNKRCLNDNEKTKKTYDVVSKEDIKKIWFNKRNLEGDNYVEFEHLPIEYRNGLNKNEDWIVEIEDNKNIIFSNKKGNLIEGKEYQVNCFKVNKYNMPYCIYEDIYKQLKISLDFCCGYGEYEKREENQLLGFCKIGNFVFYGNYLFTHTSKGFFCFFYIIYMEKGNLITFIPKNGDKLITKSLKKNNDNYLECSWDFNYELILEEIINEFKLNQNSFKQI